jgi:hypothetical protein
MPVDDKQHEKVKKTPHMKLARRLSSNIAIYVKCVKEKKFFFGVYELENQYQGRYVYYNNIIILSLLYKFQRNISDTFVKYK